MGRRSLPTRIMQESGRRVWLPGREVWLPERAVAIQGSRPHRRPCPWHHVEQGAGMAPRGQLGAALGPWGADGPVVPHGVGHLQAVSWPVGGQVASGLHAHQLCQ